MEQVRLEANAPNARGSRECEREATLAIRAHARFPIPIADGRDAPQRPAKETSVQPAAKAASSKGTTSA